jgi:hypothetical protein
MTSHQNQVLKVIKEQNLTERRTKQSTAARTRKHKIRTDAFKKKSEQNMYEEA